MLRPDRLDAAGELTPRLLHQKLPATAGPGRMSPNDHDNYLQRNVGLIPIPLEGSGSVILLKYPYTTNETPRQQGCF